MYVHEVRKDTAEDADLYEELRDAWDGIDYAGLPSFDDVLPDILEWVRGIRVADPHGTPEQQWNWWRETYATADYGQADLAGYTSLSDIPQCGMEDGSTDGGYERICEWRAVSVGNRMGESYVLVDGGKVLSWGGTGK